MLMKSSSDYEIVNESDTWITVDHHLTITMNLSDRPAFDIFYDRIGLLFIFLTLIRSELYNSYLGIMRSAKIICGFWRNHISDGKSVKLSNFEQGINYK